MLLGIRRQGCLIVAAAALVLLIAGCGGGGKSTSTTASPQAREEALQKHREELQHFGLEASGAEARQAEAAFHGYLDARASGEWSKACSYETKAIRHLFGRFNKTKQEGGESKSKGCAGFMETSTRKLSAAEREGLAKVKVTSVRVEGDQGYVLYEDADGVEHAMSMKREGGKWKFVGALGTALE